MHRRAAIDQKRLPGHKVVPDRLGQMAREMVDRKPPVIVCVSGQGAARRWR